jgi:hypothetical protein
MTRIAIFCFFAVGAFGQIFTNTRTSINGDVMTVTVSQPRFRIQAVAGSPYSADQVSQHTQTLADGTHITQPESTVKMWRDSEGRTRTERTMDFGSQRESKFVLTEILDPVAKAAYVLDDQNKVVHKFTLADPPVRKTPVAASTTAPPPKLELSFEKLGTKNIEGVIAEGNRSTNTIPIGAQGNDRPMVTVGESWFSQELKMTVLSTFSDPRNGEGTTKLINISRAEPDASLFVPPAGYSVVEEKDSAVISVKRQ